MKNNRVFVVLTLLNMLLVLINLMPGRPAAAQTAPGILRGTGLEIVDASGKVRADIRINPQTTMPDCAVSANPACGRTFPESVLLHMSDPNGLIRVKIDADQDGSGLMLANNTQQPGLALGAKASGASIALTNPDGRNQLIRP